VSSGTTGKPEVVSHGQKLQRSAMVMLSSQEGALQHAGGSRNECFLWLAGTCNERKANKQRWHCGNVSKAPKEATTKPSLKEYLGVYECSKSVDAA
jgi:hypothetical protein